MNKRQYKRWRRLSIGLAQNGWPHLTPARRSRLVSEVTEFLDDVPRAHELSDILDWDGNRGTVYLSDEVDSYFADRHHHYNSRTDADYGNKFLNQLGCCIRAGFDVAVAPSAGVIAFTVGDLRKVFRRKLPGWVQAFFTAPITSDISDAEGVWL